ncbi:unnamed protein product [Taenia asiatica]|uniref:Uncharacterized protein n=1 Tax=Taenia asiatica TaxID=60517 RepID=A0A0R3VZG5_TAEAS|nr:unnamed protein product [Taenia asiatica]
MEMEEGTSAGTSYAATTLPDEWEWREGGEGGANDAREVIVEKRRQREARGHLKKRAREEKREEEKGRMGKAVKNAKSRQAISADVRAAELNQVTSTDSVTPSDIDGEGNTCHTHHLVASQVGKIVLLVEAASAQMSSARLRGQGAHNTSSQLSSGVDNTAPVSPFFTSSTIPPTSSFRIHIPSFHFLPPIRTHLRFRLLHRRLLLPPSFDASR